MTASASFFTACLMCCGFVVSARVLTLVVIQVRVDYARRLREPGRECMADKVTALQVQIARDLFGWQWQEDWQAWCPPEWPPIRTIKAPSLAKRHALRRHGGTPYGSTGALNEWSRPVIPAYQYDPAATE